MIVKKSFAITATSVMAALALVFTSSASADPVLNKVVVYGNECQAYIQAQQDNGRIWASTRELLNRCSSVGVYMHYINAAGERKSSPQYKSDGNDVFQEIYGATFIMSMHSGWNTSKYSWESVESLYY